MPTSKRSVWRRVQAGLIVVVVTFVVWLYAEANTLVEQTVEIRIKFIAPPAADLYIQAPPDPTASLTFLSPRRQVDVVRARAREEYFEIVVRPIGETPHQEIQLEEQLAKLDALLGVTVKHVDPESKQIQVHRLVETTLPIKVTEAPAIQFRPEPQVDPSDATVKLPEGLIDQRGELSLWATITQYQEGFDQTEDVNITLPPQLLNQFPNYHPTIDPSNTTIRYTVTGKNPEKTLKSIAVFYLIPPDVLGKYEAEMDPNDRTDRDIRVRGPAEILEGEDFETKIELYVTLTHDDLQKPTLTKQPTIRVPPGIEVLHPPKQVTINIREVIANVEAPAGTELEETQIAPTEEE